MFKVIIFVLAVLASSCNNKKRISSEERFNQSLEEYTTRVNQLDVLLFKADEKLLYKVVNTDLAKYYLLLDSLHSRAKNAEQHVQLDLLRLKLETVIQNHEARLERNKVFNNSISGDSSYNEPSTDDNE